MGNKAVLNISKFSFGDCSSAAALLLPTTRLDLDLSSYDARGLVLADLTARDDSDLTEVAMVLRRWVDELFGGVPSNLRTYRTQWEQYQQHLKAKQSWEQLLDSLVEWTECEEGDEKEKLEKDLLGEVYKRLRLDSLDSAMDVVGKQLTITTETCLADEKVLCSMEGQCPAFYQLVRSLTDMAWRSDEAQHAVQAAFEAVRDAVNSSRLEQYVHDSVEYPYFLDLDFEQKIQYNQLEDTHGSTMHCVEREWVRGDEWKINADAGDRLRIRDMFRVDKLNKVSAYESYALVPGHYGFFLDDDMEREDVVSRLLQNDIDCAGLLGMTSTGAGIYLLTSSGDATGAYVKGTIFDEEDRLVRTDTYKNFANPSAQSATYLNVRHMNSPINFMRRFGDRSQMYSSGEDFLAWYDYYFNHVVVDCAQMRGDESLLEVVGENSYIWHPASGGIRYIKDVFGEEDFDVTKFDPTSLLLPQDGLTVRAGVSDQNYKRSEPRSMAISIPCNLTSQFSYLTLSCGLHAHENMILSNQIVSIEFALDNARPIRFYILGDRDPENISEENPLYESFKAYDPQQKEYGEESEPIFTTNRDTEFQIIIENDLATEQPHLLHITVAATFPTLKELLVTDDVQEAYDGTYIAINTPRISVPSQTSSVTYGNYHEFKTARNEPIDDFWNPSATMADARMQYVLEVPHAIRLSDNSSIRNNYTTATLFSDVLTAKNPMDSEYRMQVVEDQQQYVLDRFRQYSGIDSCSNTISLYYDADMVLRADLTKDNHDANLAQELSTVNDDGVSSSAHSQVLKYKRIETIKAINRFQHEIKHKSNLFSVKIKNSGVNEADREAAGAVEAARKGKLDGEFENLSEEEKKKKEQEIKEAREQALKNQREVNAATRNMRMLISSAVEKLCRDYAPAHNQLFKVYFEG